MVYTAESIQMGSGNNYHPWYIQLDLYKWGQVITIIQWYIQLVLYKWGQVITIIPMVYPAESIQMGSGNNHHPNGISSWIYTNWVSY